MSTTFALQDYSFASTVRRALSQVSQGSSGGAGKSFAGPSPFEVPEAIKITIERPDLLTFQFDYANREEPESLDRPASSDGTVAVRLGENSKKILRLTLRGDIESLFAPTLVVDADRITVSAQHMSKQTRSSFRGSTRVIQSILASLPEKLVTDVRTAITKLKESDG